MADADAAVVVSKVSRRDAGRDAAERQADVMAPVAAIPTMPNGRADPRPPAAMDDLHSESRARRNGSANHDAHAAAAEILRVPEHADVAAFGAVNESNGGQLPEVEAGRATPVGLDEALLGRRSALRCVVFAAAADHMEYGIDRLSAIG